MEIQNAEWRAVKDEATGQILLYEQGNPTPVLVATVQAFAALRAIVEQI